MRYLYGRNVFITGGSSGIGLASAELLAANGYTVFAASRNPSPSVRRFPGGGEIHPVSLDVTDIRSVGDAVESVLSQADIGVVIHCAGMGIACAAEDFPAEAVAELMETNLFGVMRVNSRLLPHLRSRGGGVCVIIGSLAGVFPIPFQSHYSASKSALDAYSSALRMELRDFGIRVSLVMPGDTRTGFTSSRKYEISVTSPYYGKCVKAVSKMEKDELGGRQPISAARVVLTLCTRKNPPARRSVGLECKLLVLLHRLLPDSLVGFLLRRVYT